MFSHGRRFSDDGTSLNTNHQNLSTISSRSTTLPSSSSSDHYLLPNDTRTMEEVWNEINLSATNHHISAVKAYRGFTLQDFLAKPFPCKDTVPTSGSSRVYESPPESQPLLNLNSGPDELSFPMEDRTTSINVCSFNAPFDRVLGLVNSSSELLEHNTGRMRMLPVTESTGGDRRHKRMIKNRESAARSRARKQAYTNELENEVERLKKENAKLRRQQELQLTTTRMTKNGSLQRTSTAPF